MDSKKLLGIIFIILGIIFAVYPVYSSIAVSIILGICLIAFGLAAIFDGCSVWSQIAHVSAMKILGGILAIILGILFIYGVDAVSFLVGFEFYLMGFIMIFVGVLSLASESTWSKLTAILIIIMGIIAIFLAFWAVALPVYAAILVGICLIMYGILFLIDQS